MAPFGTSPRQGAYLVALAGGRSHLEAARIAGIGERTARRWWQSAEVRAKVREVQADAMARAAHLAASQACEALLALASIRDDAMAPVGARVMACRALLDNARGLHADFELSERVAEIERIVRQDEHK